MTGFTNRTWVTLSLPESSGNSSAPTTIVSMAAISGSAAPAAFAKLTFSIFTPNAGQNDSRRSPSILSSRPVAVRTCAIIWSL